MQKYQFSIQTRQGLRVECIRILGKDQADAEHKLRQMYRHCEIVQHGVIETEKPIPQSADIEDMLTLIVKHS